MVRLWVPLLLALLLSVPSLLAEQLWALRWCRSRIWHRCSRTQAQR